MRKKGKDKRFIQNWWPLSLLNTDAKILSKVIAQRLKKTLPFLISANKSTFVDGRIISEGARFISDILGISDTLKLNGLELY